MRGNLKRINHLFSQNKKQEKKQVNNRLIIFKTVIYHKSMKVKINLKKIKHRNISTSKIN